VKSPLPSDWCVSHQAVKGASRSLFLFLVSGLWILISLHAQAILDTNNNTLSDLWEKEYNNNQLFPPTFDPQDDPDHDGWTNEREAAAGTHPFQANPPDGIIHPQYRHIHATYLTTPEGAELLTPEASEITWPTLTGKRYILYFSVDLTPGCWLPLGPPLIAAGGTTTTAVPLSDLNGGRPDKLFWRVAIDDADTDGDGLTNAEENRLGTDPDKKTTISGLPDLWLATHFTDILLTIGGLTTIDPNADPDSDGTSIVEEALSGTDPNTADPASARTWVSVTGNGIENAVITRTGILTIPAGQSAILVVATASDEYPEYTGTPSQWNDLLTWSATPSQGSAITGSINVNSRHAAWTVDLTNGTSIPGLPTPVHIEEVRALTAPANAPLTVAVEVSATNIEDDLFPSHVAVGLLPVDITVVFGEGPGGIRVNLAS
jgi:hypothetical protein